jgi:hypothetical protein
MAGENEKQLIQDELKTAGVSRRGFIDRVKTLGFGFGAAVTLGVEGAQARTPEVSLTSTNPALASIIKEGRDDESKAAEAGDKKIRTAWFRRFWFRRWYRRFWYHRW